MTFQYPESFSQLAEHLKTAPVDLVALCHKLGLGVFQMGFERDCSGVLCKSEKQDHVYKGVPKSRAGWTILVNEKHSDVRKRFTIAHELGHYFLHLDSAGADGQIIDDQFYRDGPEGAVNSRQETEANRFAAHILMSNDAIFNYKDDLRKSGQDLDYAEMASHFQVSKQALEIRLNLPTGSI